MLFDELLFPFTMPAARTAFVPDADLTVSDGDLVLTVDVPGLTAEDLEIEVLDDALVVRGERKRPEIAEGTRWVHAERGFGRFERRVQLPRGVDPDRVTAKVDHGVLSLIVPKPERLVPRRIEITTPDAQRELETTTA